MSNSDSSDSGFLAVIATFFGWFFLWFVVVWIIGSIVESFTSEPKPKHRSNIPGWYRTNKGIAAGVLSGIAHKTGWSVGFLRTVFVVVLLLTLPFGLILIPAYAICALTYPEVIL